MKKTSVFTVVKINGENILPIVNKKSGKRAEFASINDANEFVKGWAEYCHVVSEEGYIVDSATGIILWHIATFEHPELGRVAIDYNHGATSDIEYNQI